MKEVRKDGSLNAVFGDIHGKEEQGKLQVDIAWAVDANPEQMELAYYMDGSGSMRNSGNYPSADNTPGGGGFLDLLKGAFGFQGDAVVKTPPNPVQDVMRKMLPPMLAKDKDGRALVAYSMTGHDGSQIQVVGELDAGQAAVQAYPGPNVDGGQTLLAPALKHFRDYIRSKSGAKNAMGFFVTDGEFHDEEDAIRVVQDIANEIIAGDFPSTVIFLLGIGEQVNLENLEEFTHESEVEGWDESGRRELCCYGHVKDIRSLPNLVSHLVASNTIVFTGGCIIKDGNHNIVKTYEGGVPAVMSFELPINATGFYVNVDGKEIFQPINVIEEDH